MLHVEPAGMKHGAFGNHFKQDALPFFIDGDHILQIDFASATFPRASLSLPLFHQVVGPLITKAALQHPSLFEGSVGNHGP
jgi:hypothetical protein